MGLFNVMIDELAIDYLRNESSEYGDFVSGAMDCMQGKNLDDKMIGDRAYTCGYGAMNTHLNREYMEGETISGRCDTSTPDDTYKPLHYGEG